MTPENRAAAIDAVAHELATFSIDAIIAFSGFGDAIPIDDEMMQVCRGAAVALLDRIAPLLAPRVKPLVWFPSQYWKIWESGIYTVRCEYGRDGAETWVFAISGEHIGDYPNQEAAEAAAQSDHERRILAALEGGK